MRKLNILILCMVFIFSLGLVSAGILGQTSVDTNATQPGTQTGATYTTRTGIKITMNESMNLTSVIKQTNSLCTTAYIMASDFSTTLKTSNSFGGNVATFSGGYVLENSTTYYIVCNAGGSAVFRANTFSSFPLTKEGLTIIGARDPTTDVTNNLWDFVTLNFTNNIITLNSPSDDSSVTTNLVTFNSTASTYGGIYITNMSLWTNESGSWGLRNTSNISFLYSSNLGAYYDLDEVSGTTVYDSLLLNNGTNNGATIGQTGKINNSYDFDGTSDYITTTAKPNSEFTYSAWVYRGSGSGYKAIMSSGSLETWLGVEYSTGDLRLHLSGGGYLDTSSGALTNGTWHHVVATYNGSVAIYVDGVSQSLSQTGTLSSPPQSNITIGKHATSSTNYWFGKIDEVSIYNRALTSSEILALYNNYLLETRYANYISQTFTNTYSSGDIILWNVQACDSEGDCGFASSNFTFLIDSTPPEPLILYPSTTIPFVSNGKSIDLNISVSDSNLDTCWYEYNGTNTTIGSCANTSFNYISGVNNITLWANDSAGNENSTTTSWTALIYLDNEFHNISTAETASESFTTSITSNDSLTKAYLNYNGTYYLLSESGTNWTTTIDIPLNKVQNNTFNYIYTYAGTNYSSENYYQQVNSTIFNLCNATYTTPFLNLTFKDEQDSSVLNASIPSSTWTYYLGSGLVNKTYTFTNTSVNYNYTFCATPTDRVLNVDPYVQYKQDPSYPQRIWDSGVEQYNSSVTTQNLYLLNSADGIYVTFTVYDGSGNALNGVIVNVTRNILGTETLISSGVTSSAGTITFLLNPDFTHTLSFFKENYDSLITSLAPTLTSYTITLGGSSQETNKIDYAKGILINIEPSSSFLNNGTSYNFNYTISTSIWTLDSFGFTLRYGNGTIIGSNSSTTDTGGIVSLDADTLNQSYIIMEYYYEVNDTFINKTKRWNIQTPGEFGISNLFTRISTYISANIFGIEGDDEGYFGKAFISVLILLSSTFILSYRYGIASEPAIMGIMFGILMLLNNLSLIPTPSFMDSSPISLGTLIVVIMAIFVVSSIYKEERL